MAQWLPVPAVFVARAAPWVVVPVLGGVWHAFLRRSLDRSDLPGPGGVKVLTALATGNLDRDGLTQLCAPLLSWLGPLQALEWVVSLGSLAAILGAMLAAGALGGRTAALIAGVGAATFAQGAFAAVSYGPDGPATGAVWLGVGMAWWGARHGRAWLLGIPLGAALAAEGVAIKINAAPGVVLLALTPLLVPPRRSARLGGVLVLLALGAVAGAGLLPAQPTQQASAPAALSWSSLASGLQSVWALPSRQHPHAEPLLQIGVAAAVAAMVPGRRWGVQLTALAAGIAAVGVAATTVGELLRPRYLLAAMLPALVLIGAATADLAAVASRRWVRVGLATGLAGVLGGLCTLDTVAYLSAWSDLRVKAMSAAPDTLPSVPAAWNARYARLSNLVLTDTSEVGARSLVQLGQTAPPGGVATVPLRDAREFHLRAGASLAGNEHRILEARRCCADMPLEACAEALIDAVSLAGARLVLPTEIPGRMRVPPAHQPLAAALRAAGTFEAVDPWWLVHEPTGGGGPLPCPQPSVGSAPGRPSPPPR